MSDVRCQINERLVAVNRLIITKYYGYGATGSNFGNFNTLFYANYAICADWRRWKTHTLNRKGTKDAKENAKGVGEGFMGVVTSFQMPVTRSGLSLTTLIPWPFSRVGFLSHQAKAVMLTGRQAH
jgi:hypothetical protein